MYVLLVSATLMEIQQTVDYLSQRDYHCKNNELAVLTTGVGSLLTAYSLVSAIRDRRPGYILQAGITGSFSVTLPPGELVMIREEILGDTGVMEGAAFKDVFDLGLVEPSVFPFTGGRLVNPHISDWMKYRIPAVTAVTVNEVTTGSGRISLLQQKYGPHTESMEGAAFHYVCLSEKIPFIQLRSVSNFVGERDKRNWKMYEAIQVLNDNLIKILEQLPEA